jgi:hypothetical protein
VLKLATGLACIFALIGSAAAPLTVKDIDGRTWTPLQTAAGETHLLLFISAECPISNRYAPEIDRITASYRPRHVQSFLVYTDPKIAIDAVRASVKEFHPASSAAVIVDHALQLATAVKATVTPEAVVLSGTTQRYRGRIDDLYMNAGQSRRAASQHDLRDALDAVLSGKPVPQPETPAVGCFIQGF